jgi:surface polysaccharide O-acyltransferase-like enzyme
MLPEQGSAGPAAALPDMHLLEKSQQTAAENSSRPYLYELDRLRIVTALSVVGVHVLALMTFLDATVPALQAQNAFVTLFHFTRAVFMFVTAFALVYVYERKPFTWCEFWKRRGMGVLFPYVFWSFIYYLQDAHPSSPLPFIQSLLLDLLTGQASYQLYYILLTIQFYLLFPFYLKGLRRVARHPWIVLAVSFALELGTLYAIQSNLQAYLPASIATLVTQYEGSFVLVYQFYFILGGLVALNLSSVRAFLLRHDRLVAVSAVVTLAALELNYFGLLWFAHASFDVAVAVLQPVMAFYSTAVIFCLYWLAYRQVSRVAQPASARVQRIWHTLSDSAFGIYLIHPLLLTALISLVSTYFIAWPPALVIPLVWVITATGSVAFSVLLLRIPILSRLVGRARLMPHLPAVSAWRKRACSSLSEHAWLPTRRSRRWKESVSPGNLLLSEKAVEALPHQLEAEERGAVALVRKKIGS